METTLENRIGYQIHTLVRQGKITQAAELAYQEFGSLRAFKIYLNAARLTEGKKFAKEKGCLAEFDYFCSERKYKTEHTNRASSPLIYLKNSKKTVQRGLETEIET